jgi:uncharacterized protein (DUF427 family)
VFIEPRPRRVQGIRDGRTVIDTERALMVHRRGHPLSYVFPADEIGGVSGDPEPEAPGYLRVPWDAVDGWRRTQARALLPNPYHRVDPSLVRTDLLRRSDTASYCNYKRDATYWSAVIGGTIIDDVAWSYQDPLSETLPIKGFLSFDAAGADVVAELPGLGGAAG